ncbi:hypothetical protein EZY14_009190 [Kordia sp. TARA_039_SRF]|nr:hypothetical protein EZY14_009190 [Kordia sp. TARA_039_SRF]
MSQTKISGFQPTNKPATISNLNTRDKKILQYIVNGELDKVIADNLNITMSTLDSHKRRLFEKIGANGKTNAAVIAIKKELVCL